MMVARTQRRRQEICSRMRQVSTEQGATSEKSRQTPPIGDSRRTMARHQYRHDRSIAKIERNGCHTSNCGSFHKNDQIKGDNDKFIIRRSCQDLQR